MRDVRLEVVHRSMLFMPVNVPRFLESAWRREADAVILDLEDSIPPAKKEEARGRVRGALPLAARGGAEAFVRVNNHSDHLAADLDASVWPGLAGVQFPKPADPDEMRALCAALDRLEAERGLPAGSVQVTSSVESARAFLRAREIAEACPRLVGFGVSSEDLSLDLGFEPTDAGEEMTYAKQRIVIVCRAVGVQPRGLSGTLSNFGDLGALRASAERSAARGFMGASCIHPAQVPVLNAAFSLPPERVERARRIVEGAREAEARGTASFEMEGRMVDIPVVLRAERLLARAEVIARREAEKRAAREKAEAEG
ncbi:MAG: CoA ester lyase [bacterium]